MLSTLRPAVRNLAARPVLASIVILSVAIAIGLDTAVFSFVRDLLLDPFPAVQDPDRLLSIYSRDEGQSGQLALSYPNFLDLREQNQSFTDVAAYQVIEVGLSIHGETGQVYGEMVTPNFFDVLGIDVTPGRGFLAEETRPGAHPVTVISHDLWRRRFGEREDAVGRTIRLNSQPFTIVGVAPEGFRGTNVILSAALWVPTSMYQSVFPFANYFELRSGRVMNVVGRLAPGTTESRARTDIATIAGRLESTYPEANEKQSWITVPFEQSAVPPDRRAVFVRTGILMSAVVGILLLIACVNVANVLLARTLARRRELAIRLSLGAGKREIVGMLFTENLVLAVLSGALGLGIAVAARRILWTLRPPYFDSRPLSSHLDGTVLGFAAAASLGSLLLFGLAPALLALKTDIKSELEARGGGPAGLRHRLGSVSVLVQIALCIVSLATAGFFLESLNRAHRIDPGFDVESLAVVSFDVQSRRLDADGASSLRDHILNRVRGVPGVDAAALAENRLLGGWRWYRSVSLIGSTEGTPDEAVRAGSTSVGVGYFDTVGLTLVRGRAFTDVDRADGRPVTIVNQTLARRLAGDGDVVGRTVSLDPETTGVEIVGVVEDSKYRTLGEVPHPFVYVPLLQFPTSRASLHVRARQPGDILDTLERSVRAIDPELPVSEITTVSRIVDRSLWAPRLGAAVLSVFGAFALVLAALGVFGTASFDAGRRRREIGIRLAIGADRGAVIRLIVLRGMLWAALGTALGLGVTLAFEHFLGSGLYPGGRPSPTPMIVAAALMALATFVATLVPAWRISRTDPVSAMRSD